MIRPWHGGADSAGKRNCPTRDNLEILVDAACPPRSKRALTLPDPSQNEPADRGQTADDVAALAEDSRQAPPSVRSLAASPDPRQRAVAGPWFTAASLAQYTSQHWGRVTKGAGALPVQSVPLAGCNQKTRPGYMHKSFVAVVHGVQLCTRTSPPPITTEYPSPCLLQRKRNFLPGATCRTNRLLCTLVGGPACFNCSGQADPQ